MSEQEFIDTLEKLGIDPPEDEAKKSGTTQRTRTLSISTAQAL